MVIKLIFESIHTMTSFRCTVLVLCTFKNLLSIIPGKIYKLRSSSSRSSKQNIYIGNK